jgi:uncharacterized SAM-dependent methyltransferase
MKKKQVSIEFFYDEKTKSVFPNITNINNFNPDLLVNVIATTIVTFITGEMQELIYKKINNEYGSDICLKVRNLVEKEKKLFFKSYMEIQTDVVDKIMQQPLMLPSETWRDENELNGEFNEE